MAATDTTSRISYVERMGQALLQAHKLTNWEFGVDRALTRYGCCYYHLKRITMSKYYILSDNISLNEIKNVLLHEIAHAIAGYEAGHGKEWARIARAIGCDAQVKCDKWASALPKPMIFVCPCRKNRIARYRTSAKLRRSICKHCFGHLSQI